MLAIPWWFAVIVAIILIVLAFRPRVVNVIEQAHTQDLKERLDDLENRIIELEGDQEDDDWPEEP